MKSSVICYCAWIGSSVWPLISGQFRRDQVSLYGPEANSVGRLTGGHTRQSKAYLVNFFSCLHIIWQLMANQFHVHAGGINCAGEWWTMVSATEFEVRLPEIKINKRNVLCIVWIWAIFLPSYFHVSVGKLPKNPLRLWASGLIAKPYF